MIQYLINKLFPKTTSCFGEEGLTRPRICTELKSYQKGFCITTYIVCGTCKKSCQSAYSDTKLLKWICQSCCKDYIP